MSKEPIKLNSPLKDEDIINLKAGDTISLSGIIYTARDAAHMKLISAIENNEELPFDIQGSVIYYAGPAPTPPGRAMGSCGPTTSYRMDKFAPTLIKLGLKGMIGKGNRNEEVINAIKEHKSIYFAALGGAAALIADSIKNCEIIAYEELGAEAIRKLRVEDMPLVVVNDVNGNDLYSIGRNKYQK